MKRISYLIVALFLLSFIVSAQEGMNSDNLTIQNEPVPESNLYDKGFQEIAEEDIYDDVNDVILQGDAGITPDSKFYFIESFIEGVLVGDDPETALEYKEEKLLEVQEMINSGNEEAAKKALANMGKYNEILKKEVTPELDKRVRESSKASKKLLKSFENDIVGEDWDDVKEIIKDNLKEEDRVALAAKISNKIKELCEALSELDPLEYSKVCKTDDDAPKWKRNLDKKLTKEQEAEAKKFFGIMSQCYKNPSNCKCEEISIKPFAEKCKVMAPLAVKCEGGDEGACEEMDNMEDPINLLPDYLQEVLMDIEDEYGDAKHGLHIPKECVEEGALTRDACMKVMFKIHAPPECLEALESGKIDPSNEHEAKKACEAIMFEIEAPQECIDEGLKDYRECERYMFKLDAPQECLDAGLTGSGRDDWKKCEIIRFKIEAPQECIDAGFDGTGRDDWKKCDAIRFKLDAPQECIDAGIDGSGKDDWRKCDAIKFRLDAPQECLDAGYDGTGRDDWKKCEAIKFRLDAPQECLDAGYDGTGRDDWKKCEAIKFRLEAPEECLDAGLDGTGRDDWKKCEVIRFKLDAPQECLDAGYDGTGRDDWRKCDAIKFKLEAPEECLNAGLDGTGRRDWDECNKIREKTESKGERREDCGSDQLHICDDGYCKCVDKEQHDKDEGYRNDDSPSDGWSECKDGCNDECPGADATDCVNDKCECFYYEHSEGDSGSGGTEPGDLNSGEPDDSTGSGDSGSDNTGDGSDSGGSDGGSDSGGSDGGSDLGGSDGGSDSGGSDGGSDSGGSDGGSDAAPEPAPAAE